MNSETREQEIWSKLEELSQRITSIEEKVSNIDNRLNRVESDVSYIRGVLDTFLRGVDPRRKNGGNNSRSSFFREVVVQALSIAGWALAALLVVVKFVFA